MDFYGAHYRQQGENSSSVLLQQYQYGDMPLVFACICAGDGKEGRAGGYMTKRLLAWFRGLEPWKLLQNREAKMDMLSGRLAAVIGEIDGELEDGGLAQERRVGLAGILCADDSYILLRRGAAGICLINTSFGRTCLRGLLEEGKEGLLERMQGSLQPHIGLLLATKSLYNHVEGSMIKEVLSFPEGSTEGQMERHLKELAGEAQRRGATDMGAVLLRTAP